MHLLWGLTRALAGEPTTVTLAGGARLTVLPRPEAADVAVADWVSAGSAVDPPGLPGATHLIEHLVVGTSGDDGLESVLAPWGGTVNAFTGIDYTRYAARLPAAALPTWLSAQAARMQALPIDAETLAREQAVVAEELSQRPDGLLARLSAAIDAQLWGGHPYAHAADSQTRLPESAPAPEALRALLAHRYAAPAHHLVVVGPVDPDEVAAAAQAAFTTTAPVAPLPPIDRAALPARLADTTQTPLYRAGGAVWVLPPPSTADFWALRVALDLLERDQRVLDLLPERSALRLGVDVSWGAAGGRLLLIGLHPSLRDPARVEATSAALAHAVADPAWLSDETVRAALRGAEREMLSAAWDVGETARWLGWSDRLRGHPQSPEQIAATLHGLTPADVRAAWSRWIPAEGWIPVLWHVG